MDLWTLIYVLIAAYVLNKLRIWTRYFLKRKQNYIKEEQLAQRKREKSYVFGKVDDVIRDKILKCQTIHDLLKGQFDGTFTCKQIITVYCDRAYRVARQLNLSADECFEEALKLADEKDSQLKQ